MQVRINGDEPVKARRDKARKASRRHCLPRPETAILAHIGEIGRYQCYLTRTEGTSGIGHKDKTQEAFIRLRQCAHQIHSLVVSHGVV